MMEKFALVYGGRPRKHGQPPAIRLAEIVGRVTYDGALVAYNARIKTGSPQDRTKRFLKPVRTFDLAKIITTWDARPSVEAIDEALRAHQRESQIEASRMLGDIVERIRRGDGDGPEEADAEPAFVE